jgi:hypothetical protein
VNFTATPPANLPTSDTAKKPTSKPILRWQPRSDDWQDRRVAENGKEAEEGGGRGQEAGRECKNAHGTQGVNIKSPARAPQIAEDARGPSAANSVRRRKGGANEKAPPVQQAGRDEADSGRGHGRAAERRPKVGTDSKAGQAKAKKLDGEVEMRSFEQEPRRNRELEVRHELAVPFAVLPVVQPVSSPNPPKHAA